MLTEKTNIERKQIEWKNEREPNTRLSDNSRIRAILEVHHPQYLHRSATVKAPAIRLLRLVSVVTSKPRKKRKRQYKINDLVTI